MLLLRHTRCVARIVATRETKRDVLTSYYYVTPGGVCVTYHGHKETKRDVVPHRYIYTSYYSITDYRVFA